MKTFLSKLAVQTMVPVLCALVLLNAYLVWKDLESVENSARLRAEAAKTEKAIAEVGLDLQTMETSQRGYLLTGDASYLKPYGQAREGLATHFRELRSRVAEKDRSLTAQIESLAEAKTSEMNETIRLRQLGYRHRAFLIEGSNQGQQLMEKARAALDALSSAQASKAVRYGDESGEALQHAARQSALGSCLVLAVSVVAFLVFNWYRSDLERRHARLQQELEATAAQLEKLSATVFTDVRALLGEFQDDADALLNAYGGYLPRQAHDKVAHIEQGAGRMISTLDGLNKGSSESQLEPRLEPVQSLSA